MAEESVISRLADVSGQMEDVQRKLDDLAIQRSHLHTQYYELAAEKVDILRQIG